MSTRRDFLSKSALASAAIVTAPFAAMAFTGKKDALTETATLQPTGDGLFPAKFGIGGVALGNGWHTNTNEQITATLNAAWDAGVRYFDTSPFYGFGLSERRLGHFLCQKPRAEYLLSTKVGRIFEADRHFFDTYNNDDPNTLWKQPSPFKYKYDYTAAGVRRAVEDSLERLGVPYLDMVMVHDLSPDNGELGDKWTEQFAIAAKGAFPELTRMRAEGLIKGWGLGVNKTEPVELLLNLANARPDATLLAGRYTLLDHAHALQRLMPAAAAKGVDIVVGGPYSSGILAGGANFEYQAASPEIIARVEKIKALASRHDVPVKAAAVQFALAHPAVAAVIPGASKPSRIAEDHAALKAAIPADFWREMREQGLVAPDAPLPGGV